MSKTKALQTVVLAVIGLCIMADGGSVVADAILADHVAVTEFPNIPLDTITAIGADYNIYYVHTSHGSQILTGIGMVQAENAAHAPPSFYEWGDDLGHVGDTTWAPHARTYLTSNPDCNMAMFSWCGGCSDNTEAGIDAYLAKMEELEAAFPAVIFIYMTGHLDGTGIDGNLYRSNNQIRDYCAAHGKILFDFADIESWDPDGNYYPDETDACYWCTDWCAQHTCPSCGSCAHSHCFNCYLKGKAWWWMMAQVSGWVAEPDSCCVIRGDVDHDGSPTIDIADLVWLVDYMFSGGPEPPCWYEGDIDGSGTAPIDIDDLVYLVDFMFTGGPPPPPCP